MTTAGTSHRRLVIGYAGTVLLVLFVILVVVYFAVMIGSLDDVS